MCIGGCNSCNCCDENTLLGGKELAEKYNAHLSIHVSETRKEVANCFKKSGMYPVSISTALTSSFQKNNLRSWFMGKKSK